MSTERRIITVQPAPKLAGALAVLTVLPALALLSYDPPIVVVIALLIVSLGVAMPAIHRLWRPDMTWVMTGAQLLGHHSAGRLVWRAQCPRAVVTPWAISFWSPWRGGVTIFRAQVTERDFRRLAAWLHR